MPSKDIAKEVRFDQGVPANSISDGSSLSGTIDGNQVLLVRRGRDYFAIGANCTHYGGELAKGLIVGDTIRCPLHHACFSLRTGEALRAPALDPVGCWKVEQVGEILFIREKVSSNKQQQLKVSPRSVVIVGGGAAGLAAADMLRREGFEGRLIMISADKDAPYDRPNLSKDYLAGTAMEDWMPLRPGSYYSEHKIELLLNVSVSSFDAKQRRVHLSDGRSVDFDALLLATGAEPVRLAVEEGDEQRIHYLRSFADSRAIVTSASTAKNVVVVGASFIGLEVAASLRERNIGVHLVAPDHEPLERVLGEEVGAAIRKLHEARGVTFYLGRTVKRMDRNQVTLSDGTTLTADFLVAGIGVHPRISLAEDAGLEMDRGIVVDQYLETSVSGIFAAGDIARWPYPPTGERIRVEHWVVAERQGQTAAKNILGKKIQFDAVPFFWSQHYDTKINYVGHAEKWDSILIEGSIDSFDCTVRYIAGNRIAAVATIGRDMQSLQAERSMETAIAAQ
jgi:NADPH-dependent 2,4-dienoyl-CoA reductase/sulfur reductase-like enzyme/nitrite reductase/ring-hydroxylating ferredoxin subunit